MPFRKLKNILLSILVLVTATLAPHFAHAGIIYDNVGQPQDWGSGLGLNESDSPSAQIGDQVTLSGTGRHLVSAQIAVLGQVDDTDLQITLRLYAQDGLDSSPGTLLYESVALPRTVHATASLIDFDIPNVVVPDTLTWTLQFNDSMPWLISILDHDPVSIGSSPDHGWVKFQGQPFSKTFPIFGDGRRFVARFEAVPEPATQILLVVGVIGTFVRRGIRHRRYGEWQTYHTSQNCGKVQTPPAVGHLQPSSRIGT